MNSIHCGNVVRLIVQQQFCRISSKCFCRSYIMRKVTKSLDFGCCLVFLTEGVNHFSSLQDRQCRYNVTLRTVLATIVAVVKQWVLTYSECVYFLALGTQHVKRMHHVVICVQPFSTIFSTLSHKRQEFRKKKWTKNFCFEFLYDFCLKQFSF